jgi:hypothetical protein
MRNNDRILLLKIVQYAKEIDQTIERFSLDLPTLSNDFVAKTRFPCAYCRLESWLEDYQNR